MKWLKNILIGLVIFTMALPLVDFKVKHFEKLAWYKEMQLGGVFEDDTIPNLTVQSWLNGSFQTQFEKGIKAEVPLRSFLIRTRNQYAYHLFDEAKASGVKIGKNGYIFGQHYIDAYNSDDFLGDSVIAKRVEQLEKIRLWLKDQGKDLIMVQAPGKGFYYPEHFKDVWVGPKPKNQNYLVHKKYFEASSIPYLDVQQWFFSFKEKHAHQIYPKTGIHWSLYGEYLFMDSLNRRIELLLDTQLTRWETTRVDTVMEPRATDADIEEGMNLLYPIKKEPFWYPKYKVIQESKVPAMVISDSFFWNLFSRGLAKESLLPLDFLFYFEDYRSSEHKGQKTLDDLDLAAQIEKASILVIISTDAKLSTMPWGFIETMQDEFPAIFHDTQTP